MISLAVPSVWEARKPAVLHQAPLPDRAVVNGRIGQEAGQRCVITRPWRLPQTRPWPLEPWSRARGVLTQAALKTPEVTGKPREDLNLCFSSPSSV